MKSPADLDKLKIALRDQLCVECEQRPAADKTPPPNAAQCESDCTLFHNIPRLARVAEEGEPPCGYEVFAKSLEPLIGPGSGLDIAHALSILENADVQPAVNDCATATGCARVGRIATALACYYDKPR